MFDFNEPEGYSLNRIKGIIYSNIWVLGNLGLKDPKDLQNAVSFKFSREESVSDLKRVYVNWANSLFRNENLAAKTFTNSVPANMKERVTALIAAKTASNKKMIQDLIQRIESSEFDSDFEKMGEYEVSYFTKFFFRKLNRSKNLIYFLIQMICEEHEYTGVSNMSIEKLISEFFRIHSRRAPDRVVKEFTQPAATFFEAVKQLLIAVKRTWKYVCKDLLDFQSISIAEKLSLNSQMLRNNKRLQLIFSISHQMSLKGSKNIVKQVSRFLKKYSREPRLHRVFESLHMLDEGGNYLTHRFAQHLKYFNGDLTMVGLTQPVKLQLFKATHIDTNSGSRVLI